MTAKPLIFAEFTRKIPTPNVLFYIHFERPAGHPEQWAQKSPMECRFSTAQRNANGRKSTGADFDRRDRSGMAAVRAFDLDDKGPIMMFLRPSMP